MATETMANAETAQDSLSPYMDVEPFWVIWQASVPASGVNRIRRISQNYGSEARAEADAERFRRSGTITWVEEARPLSPQHVPAAAFDALRGTVPAPARDSLASIGSGTG